MQREHCFCTVSCSRWAHLCYHYVVVFSSFLVCGTHTHTKCNLNAIFFVVKRTFSMFAAINIVGFNTYLFFSPQYQSSFLFCSLFTHNHKWLCSELCDKIYWWIETDEATSMAREEEKKKTIIWANSWFLCSDTTTSSIFGVFFFSRLTFLFNIIHTVAVQMRFEERQWWHADMRDNIEWSIGTHRS